MLQEYAYVESAFSLQILNKDNTYSYCERLCFIEPIRLSWLDLVLFLTLGDGWMVLPFLTGSCP